MNITTEKIKSLLTLINRDYPDWKGFSDQRIIDEEINYKTEASAKAHQLLSSEKYKELLDSHEYPEIYTLLKKVAQASGNLLYMAAGVTSDIGPLYIDIPDKGGFCREMYEFIFGSDPSPVRLDKIIAYYQANSIPTRWSFLTYCLFTFHPDTDIHCRPGPMNWFLKYVGYSNGLSNPPSGDVYKEVLETVKSLGEQLPDKPKDMIAIHSFIWVAYQASKYDLGFPFNELFENWEEANQAFDLLGQVMEIMGVKNANDKRFAMTLPQINSNRRCLRMDLGRSVPIDFERKPNSVTMVHLDLAAKTGAWRTVKPD